MTPRPGAVQKEGFLPQICHGHRAAGFRHFAGNAFSRFVGHFHPVNVDVMGNVQPRFLCLVVQKRYHAALHPEAQTHFMKDLLQLVSQFHRLRQNLGYGVKGR